VKTTVSVPDDLFRQADRLAKRQRKSRNRLYAEAIGEYIARHDPDEITRRMNEVADATDTSLDPFVAAATARVLRRNTW
jgi:predicted transcriptional regulator